MSKTVSRLIAILLTVCICLSTVTPVEAASKTAAKTSQKSKTTVAKNPIMIAHRGYSKVAPDNTIAAFERAGKAGFWGIETDVKETKDGVLVCSHSSSLSSMTNGKGNINQKRWSYIKKLRVCHGNGLTTYPKQRIATLSEYLDICKKYGCVAILDLKWSSTRAVKNTYKMVKKKGMLNQTIFQSSVKSYLQTVRKLNKNATLWYLVNSISDTTIRTAKSLKCKGINSYTITEAAIKKAHKNGLKVCCWLCEDKTTSTQYKKWGIDHMMQDEPL